MLAQYVFFNTFTVTEASYLFPIMLGRLNARTRFRAMAEASIPLRSIDLGETSSSQRVDQEQPVRVFFFFCIIKDAQFLLQA